MRLGNPFRDEAAAFRLVLLTLGALAVLVVAARIATLLGVAVLVAELLALAWLVRDEIRRRHAEQAPLEPARAAVSDTPPDDRHPSDAGSPPNPATPNAASGPPEGHG